MPQNLSVGCLIMAAGNASRFGANKLEATFHGQPLIARTMDCLEESLFSRVTVVTQYPQIAALAQKRGFAVVENLHPDWGISHTIALGTAAMRDCDGILYLVGDQPLLDRESVSRVVRVWLDNPDCIVGACHHAQRGNPNLFPQEFFSELMALTGDRGGSRIIRAHEDRFVPVQIGADELTDVDTPQILSNLQKKRKI